eukprot:5430156-Prymnesium_polylepis.1
MQKIPASMQRTRKKYTAAKRVMNSSARQTSSFLRSPSPHTVSAALRSMNTGITDSGAANHQPAKTRYMSISASISHFLTTATRTGVIFAQYSSQRVGTTLREALPSIIGKGCAPPQASQKSSHEKGKSP